MITSASHRGTRQATRRARRRRLAVPAAALCSVALAAGCAGAPRSARVAAADPPTRAATAAAGNNQPGQPVAATSPPPATAPDAAQAQHYLTAIHVGTHQTYDRIVFQFTGGTPGVRSAPVHDVAADPSGRLVPLPGRAFLRVVFNWASEVRQNPAGPPLTRTYRGPDTLSPLFPTLLQVSAAGDFEGT